MTVTGVSAFGSGSWLLSICEDSLRNMRQEKKGVGGFMKEEILPEALGSQSVPEVSSSECIRYKNLVHTSSLTHIFNPCAAFFSDQSK